MNKSATHLQSGTNTRRACIDCLSKREVRDDCPNTRLGQLDCESCSKVEFIRIQETERVLMQDDFIISYDITLWYLSIQSILCRESTEGIRGGEEEKISLKG